MKRINIIGALVVLLTFGLMGCDKDTNSNDLAEAEVIKVEGLQSSYSVITDVDVLDIKLDVTSNLPDAQFEYVWAIYPTSAEGALYRLDTIARTKDLNYAVKLAAQEYQLVSIVKNQKTGLAKYTDVPLVVNTEYTRGWYVLKDDGINSDLDQFFTEGSIVPSGKKNENVFSSVNGRPIEGKGLRLTYFSDYRSTVVTETPANTKTLFAGTEKNISAIHINTLKEFRDKNTVFWGANAVNKDMVTFMASSTWYMMNNNHIHGISGPNSGFFGSSSMRDDSNTPHELSPYFLTSGNTTPFLFDNTSSSFVFALNAPAVLSSMTDKADTKLSAKNNNQRMLYMSYQDRLYDGNLYKWFARGWALFEDKTTLKKTLGYLEPRDAQMSITTYPVDVNAKLNNSSKHTLLIESEGFMYFVHNGRDVYSHALTSGNEVLQFSVPGNEEVTFIRHRKYSETNYGYDYVMIGTKVGPNYKVRMFQKQAGNLLSTPVFVLEGKGAVRDVMYISPTVSTSTYPTGY
ncbi:PKD-like family lipoprotein [Sphingobacterium yanglingense]|uniref:PKD family protein n=1 Tax=Sphingobacterium yanglingense TaxID=1437280 RepID=A0A4R6W4W4_9SPHI|nr:PKD-like family lipoprotein [Sphingobacterium yanglingense]TDQ72264.1 PKD family protein [Sphingobacterium yanglingense]